MKQIILLLIIALLLTGCGAPAAPADIAATTLPVYEFTLRLCEGPPLPVTRLVTEEVIRRVLEGIEKNDNGVAAVPVTDTIKRASGEGQVLETLDRSELYAMQTPQGFKAADLFAAHQKAAGEDYLATDDAALVEYWGKSVYLTEGSRENLKLPTPVDLAFAEAILRDREEREAVKGC